MPVDARSPSSPPCWEARPSHRPALARRRARAAARASGRFAAAPALGIGLLMAPSEAWALAVGTVTFVVVDAALARLVDACDRRRAGAVRSGSGAAG